MADETQTQEEKPSLSDIASDTFGEQYKRAADQTDGDDSADAAEADGPSYEPPLTVDGAYEQLQEAKDEAVEQGDEDAESSEASRPEPEVQEQESDTDGEAQWSTADLETASTLNAEWQSFQRDLQAFAQAQQSVNLNELEKTDRAKAQAIRTQLAEAEQDLRHRHQTLTQAAQELQSKAQQHQTKQAQKQLESEKGKMLQKAPELRNDATKKAFVGWLREQGFRDEEIDRAADHRLVVPLFRQFQQEQGGQARKAPVKKRGAKARKASREEPTVKSWRGKPTTESKSMAQLRSTGRLEDAVDVLVARRQGAGS